MSRLTRNIAANLSGRLITAALGLLLVPVIVRLMGIEAYGLVAFFATVQAVFNLLDLGLSSTINREMARLCAVGASARERRNMMRTLEMCYWAVALVIALFMLGLAPIVTRWVRPQHLSRADIQQAALIMGAVMALQWPLSFYEGALIGLQRQLAWNVVSVTMACLRQIGVVVVLWAVSRSVQTYLVWQVFTSALQTGLTAWLAWRTLPEGPAASFDRAQLAAVWRFAAGITGTAVVSLGLAQMDKLVLSRLLPLDQFGYYTLASVAAGGLQYLIGPVYTAVFPRFSQLMASGDADTLRTEYHRVSQIASVIVLPAALVLIVFAPLVLQLWTRDAVTVSRTSHLVMILSAGMAMNALIHVPYALQLASGWTTLTMYTNAIALCVLAPLTIALARLFGAPGAAAMWVLLNAGYVLINVPLMHRRLLRGEQWRWYCVDVGVPLLAAAGSVALWFPLSYVSTAPAAMLIFIVGVSLSTLSVAAIATPETRAFMSRAFARNAAIA